MCLVDCNEWIVLIIVRMIKDLAEVLEQGHRLKNLTLRFSDRRLVEHVTSCAQGKWDCGFRDQLRDALNALRMVRGIGNVQLIGINAEQARELKHRMESSTKVVTFQDLPQEIRDKIYGYSLDWSDISKVLARSLSKWQDQNERFPYPKLTCPTVLRLNKKINKDALAVLHNTPLNLHFPTELATRYELKMPRLLLFIKPITLRRVKTLNITMEHWKWAWCLVHPLNYVVRMCDKLEKLHITVKNYRKQAMLEMPRDKYPAIRFHHNFEHITAVRDLDFGVSGNVPENFVFPLVHTLVERTEEEKFWIPLPLPGTDHYKLMNNWES